MPIKELLFGPQLRGPMETQTANTQPWAGRTTLDSGSGFVTVSTAMVAADSIILATEQVGSADGVASAMAGIAVNSIVAGVSFALTRRDETAAPWDSTIMWSLMNPAQ